MKRDENLTFTDEVPVGEAPAATSGEKPWFRIEGELARGGLGRVLRAWDPRLERVVAVKTLIRSSPGARARFERETLLTARLQHPNIVPVYEGGVDEEGLPYLAMRLVQGRTLAAVVAQASDRLSLLPHVVAAAQAVAYAHHHRVAHRDLKPDNILVGDFGETVVIDWGIAKDLDAVEVAPAEGDEAASEPPTPSRTSGTLTRAGAVVGTPAYMPPEQAAGAAVDLRADVYALGAVLYHVLAGAPPYDGAPDVLAAVRSGPPTPLAALAPTTPADLVAVVTKAMARSPDDRYADAAALAGDLQRFLTGRLVDAHEYSLRDRALVAVRRNPLAAALTLALAGSVAASFVGVSGLAWVAEQRRAEAVEARDLTDRLRVLERDHLDEANLTQAELVLAADPYRALRLLAELSEARHFDGRVRTAFAAALAAAPERSLPGPGVVAAGYVGDAVVAVTRAAVLELAPEGGRVTLAQPRGEVLDVAFGSDRVAWCTTHESAARDPRREDRGYASPTPCNHVRPWRDGFVWITTQGRLTWWDGAASGLADLSMDPVDFVDVEGDRVVVSDTLHHRVVGWTPGDGAAAYGPYGGATYGVSALGESALVLGSPPLRLLTANAPARVLPLDVEWLEDAVRAPDGGRWVSGATTAVFRLSPTGELVRRVALRARPRTMAVAGDELLVGLDDGGVWAVTDGHPRRVAQGPGPVDGLGVDAGGGVLAVGGESLHVFGARPEAIAQVGARPYHLLPTGDGLWVAGGTGVWRVRPDGVTQVSERPAWRLEPCGGQLWVGEVGGIRSLDGGPRVPVDGRVASLVCAPDGEHLGAASLEGTAVFVDARTGSVERRHRSVGRGVVQLFSDAAGGWWFAGDRLLRWDAGGRVVDDREVPDTVARAVWSGDHVQLVTEGGSSWRWGPDGVSPTGHLGLHSGTLASRDGVLWVAGTNGQVAELREGVIRRFEAHEQTVSDLAFDPTGRFFASSSWDGTTRLWDRSVDPPVSRVLPGGGADPVVALAFRPDGTLVTGTLSGVIQEWADPLPTDPAALRAELRAVVATLDADRPLRRGPRAGAGGVE